MVVIEWLGRLPASDGVVILGRESTDYATALEAKSRALLLWPIMGRERPRSPGGFQIVDQGGLSARLIVFPEIE